MPTVTVPRTDLTTEEVVTVLRDGLGADYKQGQADRPAARRRQPLHPGRAGRRP
jgi:hypothetical protein